MVARFPVDGAWYRAEVLDVSSNQAKVRYIDYLNVAKVEFVQLRCATATCLESPAQGGWRGNDI